MQHFNEGGKVRYAHSTSREAASRSSHHFHQNLQCGSIYCHDIMEAFVVFARRDKSYLSKTISSTRFFFFAIRLVANTYSNKQSQTHGDGEMW